VREARQNPEILYFVSTGNPVDEFFSCEPTTYELSRPLPDALGQGIYIA
jgi:hypothetical protein